MQFLDTHIIIRLLTGDDPKKQAASQALFEQIEQGAVTVFIPDLIIGECIFVLSSPHLYHLSRKEVVELLSPIVQLPNVETQNRSILLQALHIYGETSDLDFEDAYLVAAMEHTHSTHLFSYDRDFDQFRFIKRREPSAKAQVA
jgi:predicted nucleic acid-binding protein